METQQVIDLNEDFNLSAKGIFPNIYHISNFNYFPKRIEQSWDDYQLTIQRNLRDDSFNLSLTSSHKIPFGYKSNFQINNKDIDISLKPHGFNTPLNDKVHHSFMNGKKFSKVDQIAAGIHVDMNNKITSGYFTEGFSRLDIGSFMLLINNLSKTQNVNVDSNQIIHIKTLNSLKIIKNTPMEIKSDYNVFGGLNRVGKFYKIIDPKGDKKSQEVSILRSYNNTFLVPRDISRYYHNEIVYDVYMSNEDGTDISGDKNITDGFLSTSETGNSKMHLGFHSSKSKKIAKQIDGQLAYKIGYFSIEDYSFYDYDKQRTVIGASSQSSKGDMVSYGLKGDYIRQMQLGINCDFDIIKIYETKNFHRSILKPYRGTVKLNLHSKEYDETIKMNIISSNQLKELRNNFDDFNFLYGSDIENF